MLQAKFPQTGCLECGEWLADNVYAFSLDKFGAPLCRLHQKSIKSRRSTPETTKLYFALKKQNIPALLEQFDGFKTIDITIPCSKVHIEVDGFQHNRNHKQALSDLQRTYYSFLKGYFTLRIPNSLIENDLENTVDYVIKFLIAKSPELKQKIRY